MAVFTTPFLHFNSWNLYPSYLEPGKGTHYGRSFPLIHYQLSTPGSSLEFCWPIAGMRGAPNQLKHLESSNTRKLILGGGVHRTSARGFRCNKTYPSYLRLMDSPRLALQYDIFLVDHDVIWRYMTSLSPPFWISLFSQESQKIAWIDGK